MSGKIFLSYRREDNAGFSGRVYDRLIARFPSEDIFFDVDSVPPGTDFVATIHDRIQQSDVVLVMVGLRWLTGNGAPDHNRLADPKDFVRLEVALALQAKKTVVPVLIDAASMPADKDLPQELQPFVRLNALRVTHQRFSKETADLVQFLDRTLQDIRTARERRTGAVLFVDELSSGKSTLINCLLRHKVLQRNDLVLNDDTITIIAHTSHEPRDLDAFGTSSPDDVPLKVTKLFDAQDILKQVVLIESPPLAVDSNRQACLEWLRGVKDRIGCIVYVLSATTAVAPQLGISLLSEIARLGFADKCLIAVTKKDQLSQDGMIKLKAILIDRVISVAMQSLDRPEIWGSRVIFVSGQQALELRTNRRPIEDRIVLEETSGILTLERSLNSILGKVIFK